MVNLDGIVTRMSNSTMSIDRLCKIKKYLTIEEKFKFADEYNALLTERIKDYPNYESFIAFVLFNLKIVQAYTDIELELTYEEFDKLQSNGLIDKIVEFVGADYSLLFKLIQMKD